MAGFYNPRLHHAVCSVHTVLQYFDDCKISGSGSATFCHTLPVSEVGTDISGFLGSPPGTERAVSSQQAAQTPSPQVYSYWFKFQVLLMMVVSHVKRGEPIAIYWTQFQTLCYVELRNPTWESNPRPLGRQSHLRPLDQRRSLLFITIYFLIFSISRAGAAIGSDDWTASSLALQCQENMERAPPRWATQRHSDTATQ
uniref:SFRICE_022256 n=1 Tax=Spodoptera frugiperda TaxID=7108 RepID=A0A2H1WR93_SPOFR